MPVSSASILRSHRHLPAPGFCLRTIVPDWLHISGAARYWLQTVMIEMKGKKSSVKKKKKRKQQNDLQKHKNNLFLSFQSSLLLDTHTQKVLCVYFLRISCQSNINPDIINEWGEQHIAKWSILSVKQTPASSFNKKKKKLQFPPSLEGVSLKSSYPPEGIST